MQIWITCYSLTPSIHSIFEHSLLSSKATHTASLVTMRHFVRLAVVNGMSIQSKNNHYVFALSPGYEKEKTKTG